jgi:hypothetical protein
MIKYESVQFLAALYNNIDKQIKLYAHVSAISANGASLH